MKPQAGIGTLLVIGEVTDDTEALAAALAADGILAGFARDGTKGLELAAGVQPDAILLDTALPDADAFKLCGQLKAVEQLRAIPVIFALAPGETAQEQNVFAAGGTDYLYKPLRREELLSRVGTHMRLQALRRRMALNTRQSRTCTDKLRQQVAERTAHFLQIEQRLRDILDNISDFLYLLEPDQDGHFRFVEVNLGVERLMQMPRADIVGKRVEEVVPRASEQGVLRRLQRCVDTGTVITEEIVLDTPSGQHMFQATYFPIHEHSTGRVYRVASLARDITIRHQHAAIRKERDELESLLTKIVEVSPGALGIYRLSPDGKTSMPYASPRLEDVTGFNRDAVRLDAGHAITLVHPEDRERHLESIMESARTMTPWHNEFRVQHPLKGEIWIEGRSIPERAADGSILWYGFMLDVTERKRAEQSLQTSEQKFRDLADNLPDIIIRYDRECRRLYANPMFRLHLHKDGSDPLGELPAKDWRGSIPVDGYIALLRQVMETGNPAEGFMSWREDDGRVAHYIFHIVAEHDSSGEVMGALTIGRNITALKEAEMRLAESRERLRELAAHRDTAREEERRHIARELHDELGQFLSALRMQASMLRMQFAKDNPGLAEHVNTMIEMVDSNIQMVRNIASSLRPVVLDLGIVAGLEWLVDEFIRYSGIPCELDMMRDKIDMDNHTGTTLFRVAQESLTNVARHADARAVRVSLQREESHYRLRITDDGKGFEPGKMSKKSLGLIGMRERVLMLGGQIRILSEPGKGTTIKVDIPIDDA